MTLPTHAIAGLVIGAAVGHPVAGLVVGCVPDLDHLYSYVKHGYLRNWKTFYQHAFGKEDLMGDQRNILHNVLVYIILSAIVFFVIPQFFLVFALAYFSHLLLDAVDTSDYFPLYPSKSINIKGFLDFYSWQEFILFAFLAIIFLIQSINPMEFTNFIKEYFGIIGVLIFNYAYIPQIIHLIQKKDSTGISIGSWCIWLIGAIILLIHAIAIKDIVFLSLTILESILLFVVILLAIKYKK